MAVKLYTVFQDKKTIKNAFAIFAVVAFEQVVSKFGINCRNAMLWLFVPPCVLFVVTLIKSKNILLLVNRKTSKEKCLNTEMIGHGVAAFMYMFLPSVAWMISAFLNTKIWVCYRAGFDECGVVRSCSDAEKFAWKLQQRDAKSESQNFGLLLLTGSVAALAVVTWANHLFCARPVKERELNELVREATRSVLEKHVVERAQRKLEALGKQQEETGVETVFEGTTVDVEGKLEPDPVKKVVKADVFKASTKASATLGDIKATWYKEVDQKIDMYLDEYLVLNVVKLIYPEV